MATPVVCLRLPTELHRALRREAHRQSLDQDREVSWVKVLVEAVEQYLRARPAPESASPP